MAREINISLTDAEVARWLTLIEIVVQENILDPEYTYEAEQLCDYLNAALTQTENIQKTDQIYWHIHRKDLEKIVDMLESVYDNDSDLCLEDDDKNYVKYLIGQLKGLLHFYGF